MDVVFLTEHNTLAPLQDGKEGWYGSTLILVGVEITTGSGYLILLDPRMEVPVRARGYAVDDLVRRYRAAGGIVLVAHPEHPRLGWRDAWPDAHGMEVIDVFDQVVAVSFGRQILGLLAYPVNPVAAILSIVHWPRSVMAHWDALARERPTFGVLALDAHGGIALTAERDLTFPSHETAFRIGRLHFVTDEPLGRDRADRTRVYRAFRSGRFYNAFDGLAPANGFSFQMRRSGHRILMGDTVAVGEDLTIEVGIPSIGDPIVRVLRDGTVIHEGSGHGPVRLAVRDPGVYRVEVDLRHSLFPLATARLVPWIFSNPIYVRR